MAADLRNCTKCGRVFAYRGKNICRKCVEKQETDFSLVRKFLQVHSGVDIMEVAKGTGVDEKTIMQFMREGRLSAKGVPNVLKCDNCGSSISEGRYCEKCLLKLNQELQSVLPDKKTNAAAANINTMPGRMYSQKK